MGRETASKFYTFFQIFLMVKFFSDNQCGFQASNLWVIELKNISVLSVWFHGLCCPANILGKTNYAYSWRKNTPSTWNHLRHISNSRYCKTEECSLPGSNRNVSIYCSCYRVSHVWTAVHYQSERCACKRFSPFFETFFSVAILGNLFLMIKCSGLWKKCGYVTGLGFLTFTIGAFISFAKLGLLVKRYNKL